MYTCVYIYIYIIYIYTHVYIHMYMYAYIHTSLSLSLFLSLPLSLSLHLYASHSSQFERRFKGSQDSSRVLGRVHQDHIRCQTRPHLRHTSWAEIDGFQYFLVCFIPSPPSLKHASNDTGYIHLECQTWGM